MCRGQNRSAFKWSPKAIAPDSSAACRARPGRARDHYSGRTTRSPNPGAGSAPGAIAASGAGTCSSPKLGSSGNVVYSLSRVAAAATDVATAMAGRPARRSHVAGTTTSRISRTRPPRDSTSVPTFHARQSLKLLSCSPDRSDGPTGYATYFFSSQNLRTRWRGIVRAFPVSQGALYGVWH